MEFAFFFDILYTNILNTSVWEFIAVIFGMMSVWFAKQEKILVYPTGIVSVLIYVYICFEIKLYADAGINLFYFFMSVYGWYMWSKKKDEPPLNITRNNRNGWIITFGLFIASALIIIFLLKYFKGDDTEYWSANVPYIDTFTTAIFIAGMWLMALKRIENWIFWIIGDIISIPLYIYKGLVFTGFQFIVFLIIAIMGYLAWRKKLRANPQLS